MKHSHPYGALPPYTRWAKAVAAKPPADVDPVANFPFKVAKDEKVATGGSCFAQHIARHLSANGFNYFVAEKAHAILNLVPNLPSQFNYGTFSARYGNLYTSRQLLQLFKRAFGRFTPTEPGWEGANGGFVDPFRPEIQPGGFASLRELESDRDRHLAAVRRMFEELDIFVFTLGLTEYWYCRDDGAALPLCPGVGGGVFDDTRYAFGNMTVDEVVADMSEFIELLREVNPKAKLVLTVSPVPLVATAENRHVLVSTTYSKSVLRVAAEMLTKRFDDVAYFPSYEIITGNFNRGSYFANNLRDVVEDGVGHVMRLFLKHATDRIEADEPSPVEQATQTEPSTAHYAHMEQVMQTVCEEALIEAALAKGDK